MRCEVCGALPGLSAAVPLGELCERVDEPLPRPFLDPSWTLPVGELCELVDEPALSALSPHLLQLYAAVTRRLRHCSARPLNMSGPFVHMCPARLP